MKWFRSLLLLLVTSVVLISCGDDDKESVPDRIIIDGESFKLTKGYITGYGIYEDDELNTGSIYEILLATDGVVVDEDGASGTGQVLDLFLFSSSNIELKEGTYTYSLDFLEGTLIEGFSVDGNFDTEQGVFYVIIDGEVTISRSGDSWTIEFDFITETDTGGEIDVTGSFSGTLEEVEFD
jgi:hypothetical protein